MKFYGYLILQKLLDVIESTKSPTAEKNANIFAELVQVSDAKSLSLVMRREKRWQKSYEDFERTELSAYILT